MGLNDLERLEGGDAELGEVTLDLGCLERVEVEVDVLSTPIGSADAASGAPLLKEGRPGSPLATYENVPPPAVGGEESDDGIGVLSSEGGLHLLAESAGDRNGSRLGGLCHRRRGNMLGVGDGVLDKVDGFRHRDDEAELQKVEEGERRKTEERAR